ncbi:MAG TPA: protein kinase [Pyrinomonadaceae bacterium]|nr:protein kinase [Pyrinomonadaceae bacterium]
MIQPGTLLQNRYRVVRRIGHGGMGAVYAATDERFKSKVAIKQTLFNDATMSRAFEREAHLLNHLRHAALPKVSDHFSEGDGQFLVMEFIEGSDLSELLQKRGAAFPISDVLRWGDELLDALDYLHTRQPPVVHRDIKPQNMKLTTRGQIVLLDFGLAKGLPAQTESAASVFGYSRNYAPLEQMHASGTDARSDLYSAAATLYHLMTGALPVDALTRAGATVKVQPDPLRPAHLAHAQVPEAVGKVIHRAMSQNSALRHASAAELRAALRQAAGQAPAHDARTPAAVLFAEHAPARAAAPGDDDRAPFVERPSSPQRAPHSLRAPHASPPAFDADASHYSLDINASHFSLDADAALSDFDFDAGPDSQASHPPPSRAAASQPPPAARQSSFASPHSSFDPTVVEPSARAHGSLSAARASRVASRPAAVSNSETRLASRRRAQPADAARFSPAKIVGVAVVALALACAAAGVVLVRRSGAAPQAAETQALAPSDATSGASGDGAVETRGTVAPARNSGATTPAQDTPSDFGRESRAGGETTATAAQSPSGASSPGSFTNDAAVGAQPASSNTVSPSNDASGGDRQGLVVRSAADPSARAAAIEAEVDARARRAEEAQRQSAQPQPADGRRPPPPDGHRPPPPGGHPPPRFPPPRP